MTSESAIALACLYLPFSRQSGPHSGRTDLPCFTQPVIAGVSRFRFEGEYISPPSWSGLWGCGKRCLLSTSP